MKPDNHIFIPEKKIGVLMVNLGTPENTDYISMWLYLREFLSDRRIIELTRFLWFPILFFIILIIRPKKSGKSHGHHLRTKIDQKYQNHAAILFQTQRGRQVVFQYPPSRASVCRGVKEWQRWTHIEYAWPCPDEPYFHTSNGRGCRRRRLEAAAPKSPGSDLGHENFSCAGGGLIQTNPLPRNPKSGHRG